MELTRELLVEMRVEGLSYSEIARQVGCARSVVGRKARRWLSAELRKDQVLLKKRAFELFDERGLDIETRVVVEELGCHRNSVYGWRRDYVARMQERASPVCEMCGFRGWDTNPVCEGVCLWCWAWRRRVDLQPVVARWGWGRVVRAYRLEGGEGVWGLVEEVGVGSDKGDTRK